LIIDWAKGRFWVLAINNLQSTIVNFLHA